MGTAGTARVKARLLSYIMVSDFITVGRGAFDLPALDLAADWNGGPATLFVSGRAELNVVKDRRVNLDLRASSNGKNVHLETLRATDREEELFVAEGTLPVAVYPGSAPLLRLDEKEALAVTASSRPDAPFWKELADLSGLTLQSPDLNVSFRGTWKEPTGEGHFSLAQVRADPERVKFKVPPAEAVNVVVSAGRAGVVLRTFDAKVAGQAIHAHGNISMEGAQWGELFQSPAAFALRAGELRIQIPDADLAALADYLPAQIAPKGRLQLDATVSESGKLAGFLRVTNAATRPMGGLGILQDIAIDVSLDGRTLSAKEVTAKLGGQPITLAGKVDFPPKHDPIYDLTIKGTNVPFVRQAGLLLRGDIDLRFSHLPNGRPRIAGEAHLVNGLFLSDVRNALPSGGKSAESKPPYFSVDAAPFNAWLVDVRIYGERFLRMRTPVFNGVASLDFALKGTLGTPRAIGQVVVNEGQILLPFAAFSLQEGTARLTEENPSEPAISVVGTARKYGYDLRLEITGTPATPNVVFSSSPPLDSEQVLLMVMAGETPRNEVNYTTQQRMTTIGRFLSASLLSRVSGDPSRPDRITVSTGERISRQGRETYHVEYQLNDRWSLIGEYDEFDAYNIEAKWLALSERLRKEKEQRKAHAQK
jgi:translocation and assembly module TamB